jgi:hypothetical protein
MIVYVMCFYLIRQFNYPGFAEHPANMTSNYCTRKNQLPDQVNIPTSDNRLIDKDHGQPVVAVLIILRNV